MTSYLLHMYLGPSCFSRQGRLKRSGMFELARGNIGEVDEEATTFVIRRCCVIRPC